MVLRNAFIVGISAAFSFTAASTKASGDEGLGISKVCSRKALPSGVPDTPPPAVHTVAVDSKSNEAQAALAIVYKIESNGTAPYDKVTPNFDGEGLSLGLIQFNFAGAAQDTFRNIDISVFKATMPTWGTTFYNAIHAQTATRAIALAKTMQTVNGSVWSVKPDALKELQAFLDIKESRDAQDKAVNETYAAGYGRALQWAQARGQASPTFRETVTFVDNQVFSGGALGGMWYPQATAFRKSFADDGAMVQFVSDWIATCPGNDQPGSLLFGAAEGKRDAVTWRKAFPAGTTLPDEQGLLFALGFLKALSAVGPPNSPSQSGIFKAQVLERRAMIALGAGTANGVSWPSGAPAALAKKSRAAKEHVGEMKNSPAS